MARKTGVGGRNRPMIMFAPLAMWFSIFSTFP
jgi:hypothetical protein